MNRNNFETFQFKTGLKNKKDKCKSDNQIAPMIQHFMLRCWKINTIFG